ncbi:MAG TPA: energy transducer TonB [Candidatus Acidoferrales bacterium]|nr:energy transducer TonB [Candidatus Acidoferrales bacterium]
MPDKSAKPGEGGIGYPKCVYCPSPHYTNKARRAKVQGTVRMQVTIGADGKATGIVVVNGIEKEMDEEAVNTVKSWEFTPSRGPDGTPVAVTTTIEISFRMDK